MSILAKSICVKQWHLLVMTLLSGYAVGAIIAKLSNVLGF
jgi:uncharacterized membrane-anchored protein YhcB (DUF1043 family)